MYGALAGIQMCGLLLNTHEFAHVSVAVESAENVAYEPRALVEEDPLYGRNEFQDDTIVAQTIDNVNKVAN